MTAVTRRPGRARVRRRGEAGLTIVELMVSMALVGLLVAMVFSMFLQLSLGYRTSAQIGELQQTLIAAQTLVLGDVRQAGQRVPNGFRLATDGVTHWPVEILNNTAGPDELHVYFAETGEARVVALAGDQLEVADAAPFNDGDVILLADPQAAPPNVDPAPPVVYDACVVRIADVAGNIITLDTAAPWGSGTNSHCAAITTAINTPPFDTIAYKFAMRGYRIDGTRKDLGVLQRSMTAGLLDDWEDLGIGFTDLQVASRWFEDGDAVGDPDDDGNPELDWYSGDAQETMTAPGAVAGVPIELTVSFVVRTSRRVVGVVSAATPTLRDPAYVDNNPVGDRDAVLLEGVADASRPEELRGDNVYRWSTTRVDLRNLEVRQ